MIKNRLVLFLSLLIASLIAILAFIGLVLSKNSDPDPSATNTVTIPETGSTIAVPTVAFTPTTTRAPTSTTIATWTPAPTGTRFPSITPRPTNAISETRFISSTVDSVNLRSGAGASFEIVGALANGSQINVVGQQTTSDGFLWYEIVYGSGTAWVYSELTSITRPSTLGFPTQVPATTSTCSCTGRDLDCADFNNHTEAQACHDKCMAEVGWDIYRLDGDDNDGLACEDLPW